MTVFYNDSAEFYNGILELVKRGLTFKACAATLTITLLGGY
jgi:hypothetical protein